VHRKVTKLSFRTGNIVSACHTSSWNHGLCYFNSSRPGLSLADVLIFSLMFSKALFMSFLSFKFSKHVWYFNMILFHIPPYDVFFSSSLISQNHHPISISPEYHTSYLKTAYHKKPSMNLRLIYKNLSLVPYTTHPLAITFIRIIQNQLIAARIILLPTFYKVSDLYTPKLPIIIKWLIVKNEISFKFRQLIVQ